MLYSERLKIAREYAKLTQQELVDRLPRKDDGRPLMSQANLAKMEKSPSGKGSIYSVFIAKVCGISAEWLVGGAGEMLQNNKNTYDKTPESQVLKAMQHMDDATKYQMVKISNSLTESENNTTQRAADENAKRKKQMQ